LTAEIVAHWQVARADLEVTYRDLAAQELPHLSRAALTRSDELQAARDASVLEEFLNADVVVVGAPYAISAFPRSSRPGSIASQSRAAPSAIRRTDRRGSQAVSG
jgi:FMN-dependent NADH-azoreductase